MFRIDAKDVYYKDLNQRIREAIRKGEREIELLNVNGQRYIGDGIDEKVTITIYGVPGNDLGAFMNGPTIIVHDNAQDAVGNTMNSGKIVVHGDAGDVIGYGMRGGKIHILGDVGYRVGIHMKAYKDQVPVIISGGHARDFYGEYMAGGILILLGLKRRNPDTPIVGDYCGTGIHGGTIYIRGEVKKSQLGQEVQVAEPEEEELAQLRGLLEEYCQDFHLDLEEVMSEKFLKFFPRSHRPYGKLYAY